MREEEGEGLLAGGGPRPAPAGASFEQEVILIDPQDGEMASKRPPIWTWLLLVAAVCAVSSAGVVFALMAEVPAVTLAAWRLQLTSVFLGVGAAFQLRRMPGEDRQRTVQQAGLLAASGACLALHFGTWVYSVQATSLTHSLLFVSATPLFLAGGTWALGRPISRGELGGTAVGLVGAVLLATAAARSDAEVTLHGDLAALTASLCFVGYLLIGRRLRAWMPAFVYAFFVTALAALLLSCGAVLLDGASLVAAGRRGVFGWAADAKFLPLVLYLAIGPGIVGHTGFNTLLRYLSPLVISLACNLEPLLGSLFGWAAGVVAAPGPWTFVGGSLVMLSTAVVSLASHRREQQQASREAASRAIQRILSGDGEMQQLEKDEEGEALALTAAGDDGGWGEPWELSPRPGGGTGGGRSSRDGRPPDAG